MTAIAEEVRVPLLDRAFAASYDHVLAGAERAGLAAKRRELVAGLVGHVVEIGAGTGANLDHLGTEVERLTLLEPVPEMAARLRRKLAIGRFDAAPATSRPLTVLEAPAEAIPLEDGEADTVVSTLVLCSVTDVERALSELRRVLRPGGRLVLLEHVVADGPARRVQRAVEPAWRFVARGCHVTRDTLSSVAAAGFDVSGVRPWRLPGGGIAGPAIAGVARAPA